MTAESQPDGNAAAGGSEDVVDEGFSDWRHWAAARLAEDLPAAYPGGPSHKAGSALVVTSLTHDQRGELIGFTMPSPTALALDIAIQAAKKAEILREQLTLVRQVSPYGPVRAVPLEQSSTTYDFFEQCMLTVTFGF
ncbi:MAG: hypothetical protein ACR2HN_06915 [Tepidiformaceae bacterium]